MKALFSGLVLSAVLVLVVTPTSIARAQSQDLPAGVTDKMISDGATIFKGAGTCFACHGQEGKGVPNLGADLTDEEWASGDGSYDKIVEVILKGAQSNTGAVMPPKGGPNLSDEQVKAVAAYVWSLSKKK